MTNTYTALFYHIVFSTKNRAPFIKPEIENRIWEYLGGIARHHKMTALQVGGIEDHVHALVMAPPTIAPFEIAKHLKAESSKRNPQNGCTKSFLIYKTLAGKMDTVHSLLAKRMCQAL